MVLLVVNKLFQLYVAVFFLSKHRVWDQKTHAVSQDDWSPGKAMLQAVFCAFIPQLFTSEIPRYSFRASIAIKGRRKALLYFYFLIYYCLVIVWDLVSTQLDCLPEKKNAEIFGPWLGFLVLCSANPKAKRTGLDRIPCRPITWIVTEPARYNKSHVHFGVVAWEQLRLSQFYP